MNSLGTLLVVSGASGSGKTTLCRRAADQGLCQYSISCTTRAPRPGEINDRDYHFLSEEEFSAKIAEGSFLEHAQVHGHRYGTLKEDIVALLKQGVNIVMDIDVQGAALVRACEDPLIARCYADLYILVPMEELERRLRGRSTDDEETIALRMRNAAEENACAPSYRYILESSDRETDYAAFLALLSSLSLRSCLIEQ